MPTLISHYILGTPDPLLYNTSDGVSRPGRRLDLNVARKLAESDPIWAERGKAIQSYALLEESLCSLMASLGDLTADVAATIFYKITSSGARNGIIEKLLHKKHGQKFNLFSNAYLKQLRPIDTRRNEIVHWLSACNTIVDGSGQMAASVALIPPNFHDTKPTGPRLLISDLRSFSQQCDDFFTPCLSG